MDLSRRKQHLLSALLIFLLFLAVELLNSNTSWLNVKNSGKVMRGRTLGRTRNIDMGNLLPFRPDGDGCLSRLQHHLYGRSLEYTPSEYLITRLRQYEKLHQRCASEVEGFVQEKLPSSNLSVLAGGSNISSNSSSCQFIVWISYEGLGNKMLSLVSSFLYALVTDRILLVDRGTDMPQLFCEPFSGPSWFVPESFPHGWLHSLDDPSPNRLGTLIKSKGRSCQTTPDDTTFPNIVYIHMNYFSYNAQDKRFFCEQEQKLLKRVPWLFIRSNVYFIPGLYLMPSFREEFERLFPDPETVFRYSARYLLHPSNSVWARITRYFNAYLAGSNQLVGLQLRTSDSQLESIQNRYFSEQVWKCLLREEILPNVTDVEEDISSSAAEGVLFTRTVLTTSLQESYYDKLPLPTSNSV